MPILSLFEKYFCVFTQGQQARVEAYTRRRGSAFVQGINKKHVHVKFRQVLGLNLA